MGDRALVIFRTAEDTSPVCYLHWGGSEVPAMLDTHKELMADRTGDVQYAAARFIGIAHTRNPNSNLSLGVWNIPSKIIRAVKSADAKVLSDYSHGDAGLIIVDADTFKWQAYGGYLADKASIEILTEMAEEA